MTLFRNNRSRKSHSSHPHPDKLDNIIKTLLHNMPLTSIQKLSKLNTPSPQSSLSSSHNTAILAHTQPIVVPTLTLDIMYLFLGDIIDNKILTDTDFIEKHIEIVDCKCREQRYQPVLQCIPEAIHDDEDGSGYESDQSDTPSTNYTKNVNPISSFFPPPPQNKLLLTSPTPHPFNSTYKR